MFGWLENLPSKFRAYINKYYPNDYYCNRFINKFISYLNINKNLKKTLIFKVLIA